MSNNAQVDFALLYVNHVTSCMAVISLNSFLWLFQEREQEKLDRIQAVTNKSDVQNALDSFMTSQQQKDEQEQTKQDIAAENRERRLREMRDKLRAKQERIDAARRRKMAGSLDEDTVYNDTNEESPFISRPKIAADAPVYNTDSF